MKIKRIKMLLMQGLGAAILAGCGGGNGNEDSNPPAPKQYPGGLVSHEKIAALFNQANYQNNKAVKSNLAVDPIPTACPTLMQNDPYAEASNAITIAGSFLSLIPTAGPILGLVTGDVSNALTTLDPDNPIGPCTQQLETQVQSNFTYITGQLNTLESNFTQFQTQFYKDNYTTATEINGLYEQNLQNSIQYFNGTTTANGLKQEVLDIASAGV